MDKSIYSYNYGQMLKLLIAARESVKMTQEDLAASLEETQSFVSKCERGQRRLDVVELRMWCSALNVSYTEFMRDLDHLSLPKAAGTSPRAPTERK
jgi:transcriptional regulator with XRE-family HTH domain